MVQLSELQPAERNPNEHPQEQIDRLAGIIREYGFNVPILVRDGTRIVGGEGRMLAAQLAGLDEVPVIDLEHLEPDAARAFAIAENEIGRWSAFDTGLLTLELSELQDLGVDLDSLGFEPARLDALFPDPDPNASGPQPAPEPPEPPIPEPPKVPISKAGTVWQLGEHTLACGDCFELVPKLLDGPADLVATDPPYAIYGSSTGVASDIADDAMTIPFFEKIFRLAMVHLAKFGHLYMCCDWRSWPAVVAASKLSGIAIKNALCWDKCVPGMGSSYGNSYELICFGSKLPKQVAMGHREGGQRTVLRPNMLRYPRVPSGQKEHNAQKPVALFEELIRNSSDEGALVLEPFAGSGTTLLAAGNLGRRCVATEHSPAVVDVAVERWENHTGGRAKRVGSPPKAP